MVTFVKLNRGLNQPRHPENPGLIRYPTFVKQPSVSSRLSLVESGFFNLSKENSIKRRFQNSHRAQCLEGGITSRDAAVMAASCRLSRLLCSAWILPLICVAPAVGLVRDDAVDSCEHLRLGQYLCKDPKIDESTQEPENCRDLQAWVECLPAPNVSCRLSNGSEFRFSGDEEWLFLQSGRGVVPVSGLAGGGPLLPGIPCSGTAEVLHRWLLWDRDADRLCIDRHADRGSSRWV